jgi:hypothetical protein
MMGSRAAFRNLDTRVSGTVRFRDGSIVRIKGIGTILFTCKNGEHGTLGNVYYIPRLTANIVSCGQLDEIGYKILVRDGVMRVCDEHVRLLAKIHRSPGRLYVLNIDIARPVCLSVVAGEDAWHWHTRFGHGNFGALQKMVREELMHGLPLVSQVEQVCEAYLEGKHWRMSIPHAVQRWTTEVLELVHGDLCSPITPMTPSGKLYFLLLIDDHSRYMWVAQLAIKDEATMVIHHIQAAAERQAIACPVHRSRGRVHRGALPQVLRRARSSAGAGGTVHTATKRCHREAKPDGGRDGAEHVEGQVPAQHLLGRSGDSGCLHTEPHDDKGQRW